MKAYKATLGDKDNGYWNKWFDSLDDLRNWANGIIDKYNLTDSRLKIEQGKKTASSYMLVDHGEIRTKIIEI